MHYKKLNNKDWKKHTGKIWEKKTQLLEGEDAVSWR
jgi:hypothetical protein